MMQESNQSLLKLGFANTTDITHCKILKFVLIRSKPATSTSDMKEQILQSWLSILKMEITQSLSGFVTSESSVSG
jgi:hypothetical protein